ncbi:MAG: hypothetical protein FH748_08510 [Balneolaceae bacterium]|nr:hypothetical protein [Balneolaceae bacterium]
MDQIGERVKHITNDLKQYLEKRFELFILSASDRIAFLVGRYIQKMAGYSVLFIGLVFALLALALYLGDLLESQPLGYLIVSAPMVLIGIVLVFSKPSAIASRIQQQLTAEVLEGLKEKDRKARQLSLTEENKTEPLSNG